MPRTGELNMGHFSAPDTPSKFLLVAAIAALAFSAPVHAAGRQVLRDHVPAAVKTSTQIGPVDRTTQLHLAIGLPLRNREALDVLLRDLSDRSSPNYQRYLSPEQFAEQFGPTEQDYDRLIAFAEANGLIVSGKHPNRTILDVTAPVGVVEKVFHVNLNAWENRERGRFYAPDREPSIDLDVAVQDVSGLDNVVVPRPMNLKTRPLKQASPLTSGSGPAGLFIGNDFRSAYAPGVTLTGSGQAVGLLEFDGFFANDVKANFAQAGLPAVATQTVLLDGYNGVPGGANIEVILDIMMAGYMAPGISKVIVYEGYYPNDVLNRMATDNLASQLSSSWVFGPINATTEQIFQQMIAQGQSLLQASGDSGAYHGAIDAPADDPNVTVVGGTSLTTTGAGGPWQAEATWSGSGGGVSTSYAIPSYQPPATMAAAGGSATMRNIPDVALTADIQMFLICNNGQAVSVGGTSAAAPLWAGFIALANQQAKANQLPAVGFLNPRLYTIGADASYGSDLHDIVTGNDGFSALPGYDITTGWGSPAGQHLINDLTSMPSTPSFTLSSTPANLTIAQGASGTSAITVNAINGFTGSVSLSAAGLPSGVTATFGSASGSGSSTVSFSAGSAAAIGTVPVSITGVSGAITMTTVVTLTVTGPPGFALTATPTSMGLYQGQSATAGITVTSQNGFTGSVTLAVSGLLSGVTAALNPAATGTTLTFMASGSATLGAAPVTITGTSGSLTSTATLNLTVSAAPAATFSISAAPATLSVVQGATGISTLTVKQLAGFSGKVTLSVLSLPTGVTASWSAASTATTSRLTLTASASATVGAFPLVVIATSGNMTSQTNIALTIAGAPNFVLAASSASLSLMQGNTASEAIGITPQNGFTGSVSLATTGLPAGVTASFSPASASTTSTLKFTAGASATPGAATVTITGTAGSITSTATISLTVTAAPNYALSASSTSLVLIQGSTGSSTITVTPQNGFTGTVSLMASGLSSGVTAAFSPSATAGTSTLTLTASGTASPAKSTVTITGVSGGITNKVTIGLSVTPAPDFMLSASPAMLSAFQGTSGSALIPIAPLNGFSGAVTFSASGLPSGVTATFGPSNTAGAIEAAFAIASSAAPGTSTVIITGTCGSLSHTTNVALAILVPAAGVLPVNMSSVYNVSATAADGIGFSTPGGIDGVGSAYSANLLGSSQTIGGVSFAIGPIDAPSAVSGKTVPLPAGQFTSLKLLATAVNGSQPTQTFVVTYTDGSSSSFTQGVSDWFAPQSYSGEMKAMTMAYRDTGAGAIDHRTFLLYGYSFNLNAGKTVSSITLPSNAHVIVLAMSLSANSNLSQAVQVDLSHTFDLTGVTAGGKPFTGGLDGVGYMYWSSLLGSSQTINGTLFTFGAPDVLNVVSGSGKAIPLTAGKYSALQMLATAVNGKQVSQTFLVTYTDGTTSTFTQSLSDWFTPQNFAGESRAVVMQFRVNSSGNRDNGPYTLYGYSFALNNGKTVSSVTTPNNKNVKVLAMTLVP